MRVFGSSPFIFLVYVGVVRKSQSKPTPQPPCHPDLVRLRAEIRTAREALRNVQQRYAIRETQLIRDVLTAHGEVPFPPGGVISGWQSCLGGSPSGICVYPLTDDPEDRYNTEMCLFCGDQFDRK